ncbi:putative dihydroxy-acid dehydratase [Meredithblackwellia eburnea MCA 4105]
MSPSCPPTGCDGCSCPPRNGGGVADIEDSSMPELRSKKWFNNPHNPGMTALYIERYLNFGLTQPEITGKSRPVIGIAQTGSDMSPCNRHHVELAKRVRDGIIASGGTPLEFPCHPIQETGKRPTACLDRNLSYLALVEVLYGYPLDGVVLLSGCDKTTPALLMGAATVNIPAIVMNVGPMLNGYVQDEKMGSGTVVWEMRKRLAAGKINYEQFLDAVAASAPSVGHCNTMGTASTMNAMAEALGMALPGSSSIPAVYRERGQCAYMTGRQIVELVRKDVKPSDILTREAFLNAIATCTAIGGSTNAPIHLNAVAKHIGVKLDNDDWEKYGHSLPLLVNVQPAGEWLCEEYHRAGGLPAVIAELLEHKTLPFPDAKTVNLKSIGENCEGKHTWDRRVIFPYDKPMMKEAGFLNLKGTLFDSAIMKTSVISPDFRAQYLENPNDPMAFEGAVAVFEGPEDYHDRIDSSEHIKAGTILVMRGAGPKGYPGAAEVVNMLPPASLVKQGIELPCVGDGRQSGTSGTPSILNASPEAATEGSMLGYLRDGDKVRIDLLKRRADVLLSPEEIAERKKTWPKFPVPESQTPWQEIFRNDVSELSEGMVMKSAVKFQRIAQTRGVPRDNH